MSRLAAFLGQAGQEYRQMRLGLHRIQAALARLNHPEKSFASVLIGGTNGKGSTARIVESVLRQAGHRTGLYTSPHLLRFNERILVAGQEIADESLEAILQDWSEAGFLDAAGRWMVGEEPLTWFEKATALAFEAFRRAKIDIAVLEVGLGGRMDATNVVEPLASAITSLGMDHVEVLGPTLTDIAREKAGILRTGRPTILGPVGTDLSARFQEWAERTGAILVEPIPPSGESGKFSYDTYRDLEWNARGRHQLANAAVAIELLRVLKEGGYAWSEPDLREGLRQLHNPGRLQYVTGSPPLLLDGAHNPPAFEALAAYLRENAADRKIVFLLAMMREKDWAAGLEILRPLASHFILTEVANPRCLPLSEWKEIFKNDSSDAGFEANPQAALDLARKEAGAQGLVVVTGSLFLVAEILANRDCHSK